MNIFIDVKTTFHTLNADVISLGAVSEEGDVFYAEVIADYLYTKVGDKQRNDILPLLSQGPKAIYYRDTRFGTYENIMSSFIHWLRQFDNIQFIGDCCATTFSKLYYDITQNCIEHYGSDIWLERFNDLNICKVPVDINQMIMHTYDISARDAYNMNRADIINEYNRLYTNEGYTNHALYDALVVWAVYSSLSNRNNSDDAKVKWRRVYDGLK